MKVLQLINSLSAGGAEKLLVNSVIKYNEMGVDVDILLLNGGDSTFLEKLKPNSEISIFSLGENTNVYNPLIFFKLIKFFKNYEIIHVHLFPSFYWAAFADIFFNYNQIKFKLVYTEHNTTNRRRDSLLFKVFDRIAYKRFHTIVSISDAVDVNLKNHLGDNFKNIIKIYNGIDLNEINDAIAYTKEEINFTNNHKLILQVSSFTSQKNQLTLIKSLKYLPDDYSVILVGDGELKPDCIKATNDLGLSDRVCFYGIRKDVPRILKTVDIVVLSSHYEGLSLSSVEGLASGKPFIASDVQGLTEVVENAGLLFPDNDERQLADLIIKICSNQNYYLDVVNNCIERSKKFDIKKMTESYVNLYKEMC